MMKMTSFFPVLVLAAFPLGCSAASDADPVNGEPSEEANEELRSAPNVVVAWNRVALEAVRGSKIGPPPTARALAIVHTCIYDAWAIHDDVANDTTSLGRDRRREYERTQENKKAAISYAARTALKDLYPEMASVFDQRLRQLGYAPTPRTKAGHAGIEACRAVLERAHADGANQLGTDPGGSGKPYSDTTGYKPLNPPMLFDKLLARDEVPAPGHWQAISFPGADGKLVTPGFIAPHWKKCAPFAVDVEGAIPEAPPAWDSVEARRQLDEVVQITANLTDREKSIAEYWADGPKSELPPGHWNLFAQEISKRDRHTLDDDAKMFFALTNSIADAGIVTWATKERYDYWRPIAAVRYVYAGKQVAYAPKANASRRGPAESWRPYQPDTFPTPPFAEYTSGHSAFSAAGAEVLKRFTGSDVFHSEGVWKKGASHVEPGIAPTSDVTLKWSTFSEAADEAGRSRIYGGIHFESGDLSGRHIGRIAGKAGFERASRLWSGR